MSNYFSGVTFPEQPVTPSDDAIVRRVLIPDGILTGCEFAYSGSTLTMGVGALMVCGRLVRHIAAQSWTVSDATAKYARLVFTVDLSRESTENVFDQVVDSIEYAASLSGFAPLERADINGSGIRYQVEVCVMPLSGGTISGFVHSLPNLSKNGIYAPAGYGIGQEAGKAVTSLASLDAYTKSGVFGLELPLGDDYVAGVSIRQSTLSVEGYNDRNTLQTISVLGTTTKLERWRMGGSWGPWCVHNPPMALGGEYRTTALWNGEPVYTKRLAFTASSLSAQNVSLPHGIEGLSVCVSAKALWKRTDTTPDGWRQLPSSDYSTGEWDGHIEYVNAESIKFRLGSSLVYRMKQSTEPIYVTLEYTKA